MTPELLKVAQRIVAIACKTSAPASLEEPEEFAMLTTRIPDLARAAIAQHEEIERLKKQLETAKNALESISELPLRTEIGWRYYANEALMAIS